MQFDKKPEILAPAGTPDAVKTVIEAGADTDIADIPSPNREILP